MCGIAGFIAADANRDVRAVLDAMNAAQLHRGPDDVGVYLLPGGRGGVANRRLAIRDLSPAGHMPMTSPGGMLTITYNGEVYNAAELRGELERLGYVFRSESDTEVILHGYQEWGDAVPERLRGIFAFAVLDERPAFSRLFLARDHLGVKPLYYAVGREGFLFASELAALRASGLLDAEISPAGLVGYLLLGSVPNPHTIYRGARGLEPGSTLSIALERPGETSAPRRYWTMPTEERQISTGEAVDEVRTLLDGAVRAQLVSDVPLGAFLSGGLDSSAVVALMRRHTSGSIRTCSMIFEEATYSEAPYARAMAEAAGADHHERVITASEVERELPAIFRAMDQPTVDGVNTYFVARTAREAGLTVALSGLGGDELFGGYASTFRGVPQLRRTVDLARHLPGGVPLASAIIGASPYRNRLIKARDALARPALAENAYLARRGLFAPSEAQALVDPDVWMAAAREFEPADHIAERAVRNGASSRFTARPFAWVSRAELGTYTHHQLLRDTDVMSMCHSLEVRVPFLDVKLVEAVLAMPDSVKVGAGVKPLLSRALAGDLPPIIGERRAKQGFTFPFDTWLRTGFRQQATALSREAIERAHLQPEAVDRAWQAFESGGLHWSRPWAIAALGGWGS